MRKPDMILFDYGDTLLCEPEFDALRGMHALFPYIINNPEPCSPEKLAADSFSLFEEYADVRKMGFDLHEWNLNRLLFGMHGIEFSVNEAQIEQIYWENACPGAVMPHAAEMLRSLNEHNIRTGVVSNIGWSSEALKHRLDRLLPGNRFEFVLTSSEYMVRKPDRRLFLVACHKAKLAPEQIWFCGDDYRCDVLGSAAVGMQPIWYQPETVNTGEIRKPAIKDDVDLLYIRDWCELVRVLKEI